MSGKTDQAVHVELLSDMIRPILAGQPPGVQAMTIADLLSLFLAGTHPDLREETLAFIVDAARGLVPVNEGVLFGDAGYPVVQ